MRPISRSQAQPLQTLVSYRGRKIIGRRNLKASAVAVICGEYQGEMSLLMIKRVAKEGDPWSGDMAFPGGCHQKGDQCLIHTAIRETWEEVGVDLHQSAKFVVRLSDQLTRSHSVLKPMIVAPYLFHIAKPYALRLNPKEVEGAVWIPLGFFADKNVRGKMDWKLGRLNFKLPCYWFQGKRIWGLSLRIIDELVRLYDHRR